MARIRTIKPEFFRHFDLYQAEQDTELPLRVTYAGLWTAADREGRFKWRPNELKLDCLPYDNVDFSRVLDALETRGFIVKYVSNGLEFGFIPSWHDHQHINNREKESDLPDPKNVDKTNTSTREERDVDASITRERSARVEGKGKERKGKEQADASKTRESTTNDHSEIPNHPDDKSKPSNDSEPPEDNNVDIAFEKFKVIARQCNLPVPKVLNKKRRSQLSARLNQHGIDVWYQALNTIQNSKYLRGEVNGFRATIDFMLTESSFQKIVEGNYDDREDPERCPL